MKEFLKIGLAFERIFFFFACFLLTIHIGACLFVFIAKLEENGPHSWVGANGFQDLPNIELYIKAVYFTVTTITTVGFGDISA